MMYNYALIVYSKMKWEHDRENYKKMMDEHRVKKIIRAHKKLEKRLEREMKNREMFNN